MTLQLTANANPGTAEWKTPLTPSTTLPSGSTINVTESAAYTFSILAENETSTLPDPTFSGQLLILTAGPVTGTGFREITAASPVAGPDNILLFDAESQYIALISSPNLVSGFRWLVLFNGGVSIFS